MLRRRRSHSPALRRNPSTARRFAGKRGNPVFFNDRTASQFSVTLRPIYADSIWQPFGPVGEPMGSSTRSRITCAVRTVGNLTSQIFRCHGLDNLASRADQLGLHDVAWWLIFLVALSAWFLLLFSPQRERLNNLAERQQVLMGHLKAEKRELGRLHRSIDELTRGDPRAWERAARGRLGWLEPGEVTDVVAWNHTHNIRPVVMPPPLPADHLKLPTGPLPKPQIPPLPVPPTALLKAPLVTASQNIDPEALGLVRGTPPPVPKKTPALMVQAQPPHAPLNVTNPQGLRLLH